MLRILKYSFGRYPFSTTLTLPSEFKCLSVQVQRGQLCMWAAVNTESSAIKQCTLEVYDTGAEIDNVPELVYITTVQYGERVWHVFERLK